MLRRSTCTLGVFLLVCAVPVLADFNYANFSSTTGLTLNGNAAQSGSVLRIVPNTTGQAGSFWYTTAKQSVGGGFDTVFTFQITPADTGGADGFAFVVQNTSAAALGSGGGGMGYTGIANSLAVEFDTWNNGGVDPNGNHVAVHSCGTGANSYAACQLGVTASPGVTLEDGVVHTGRVLYTPGTLRVFIDNLTTPILTVSVDLATLLTLDSGTAWVGFSAGTGAASSNHDILSWGFGPGCPVASGLVSWYKAEGNANDAQSANNGTLNGNATFASGQFGQAFSLDGSGDFVSAPDSASLSITGSLTLAGWINLASYSPEFAPVISKWNDIGTSERNYFLTVTSAGTVRADISATGGAYYSVYSAATVPLNTWTFVASVFNSSTQILTVYVNGVASGSAGIPVSSVFDNDEPLLIGAGDLGSNVRDYLNGRIDEARIFNAALTGGEIACMAGVSPGAGVGCPHHRVHGHIDTTPPTHSGTVSGQHHGTHGHAAPAGSVCPPHAPGHSPGLMAAPEDRLPATPDFVAVLNEDGTTGPARPGTVVQMFGSGVGLFLGEWDDRPMYRFNAPLSPLYHTTRLPEVRIGGLTAKVLFSGLSPGLVGVWQINMLIPENAPPGRLPVDIRYGAEELTSVDIEVQ